MDVHLLLVLLLVIYFYLILLFCFAHNLVSFCACLLVFFALAFSLLRQLLVVVVVIAVVVVDEYVATLHAYFVKELNKKLETRKKRTTKSYPTLLLAATTAVSHQFLARTTPFLAQFKLCVNLFVELFAWRGKSKEETTVSDKEERKNEQQKCESKCYRYVSFLLSAIAAQRSPVDIRRY